ncbi:hypothetical protein WJX72_000312 [[Myrmecia] bisecta]|uniref:HVA22-like protein n=1 Tax=[Myrmecia] bisecta TaxID=41462 RepID=A0AAW1PAR2_9CHLO
MSLLVPILGQVGLQVLLQPASSAVVGRAVSTFAGIGYPAYASFKTIEAPLSPYIERSNKTAQWLSYWTIYGALTVVESYTDLHRVPFYHHVKLLLLLWLQLPQFQGARRLYNEVFRRFLLRHEARMDAGLQSFAQAMAQPQLVSMARSLRSTAATVPGLAWFMRHPDNRKD